MGGQRDRGKYNKRGGRGGGRSFQATSAEEIELRDTRIAAFDQVSFSWKKVKRKREMF